MILVDTSVWIDHLRSQQAILGKLLTTREVMCHPFVIGELALGTLPKRLSTLKDLSKLPAADVATDNEVLYLIDSQKIHGLGVGYVDVHLLASVKMSPGVLLWTRDKQLQAAAKKLGVAFIEPRVN